MTKDLNDYKYYINREFTSLAFNERVLELARDERVPLLERMRFLCICSDNLDEFFEVRVAGLKEKMAARSLNLSIDGKTAEEVFQTISTRTHTLIKNLYDTFNKQLIPKLKKENINFIDEKEWTPEIAKWAKDFFKSEIIPTLSPIALDPAHPLPRLLNKSLNFIVALEGKDAFNRKLDYAVVHAPRAIPRLIPLPENMQKKGDNFVYLASIIKTFIGYLFPGMNIKGCYPFRLTRNSDLFLQEEEVEDLAKALQQELFTRHYGLVVRIEVDKSCPKNITNFLLQKHHLKLDDAYLCDGPVNLQRLLETINTIDRPRLKYPVFAQSYPLLNEHRQTLFDLIDKQDILIHHPYQSFDIVIDFVRQAAVDKSVYAIKQTLYRTHYNSVMVQALVEAARNGKEVTAVIELRARFDEEANLRLANRLYEAGVLVLYGVVGYKTHAKMTLIIRQIDNKLKRYVHLGTGNYHEKTTKHYTDLGLITSNHDICKDIQNIFHQLTGLGKAIKLKAVCHSPFTLQQTLLKLIEECTDTAKKKKPAQIIIKVNGLTDKTMIQALYSASNAGVDIHLIVRGVCCIRPGIKGVSENITLKSVMGRFLEHHRVFYFKHHDSEKIFCASADLMERNLYKRIEILFPIVDEQCKKRIKEEIIKYYIEDNRDTWQMQTDGTFKAKRNGNFSAQSQLIDKFS